MNAYTVTASTPQNPQYGEWEFKVYAETKAKAISKVRGKARDEIGRMFGPIAFKAQEAE